MNKGRIIAWTMFIIGVLAATIVACETGGGYKAPMAGFMSTIGLQEYVNIIGDYIDVQINTLTKKILMK